MKTTRSSILANPWRAYPRRWGHPLHSMCSYMAMFPPALARYFIEHYSKEGDIVADPFAGRGTGPVEALLTKRVPLASDLNPVAVALNQAKITLPSKGRVIKRIGDLEKQFRRSRFKSNPPKDVALFFHRKTMREILWLKAHLNRESKVDRFLIGIVLGALHGTWTKKGQVRSYLSVHTPNTMSLSPGCMRNHLAKTGLKPQYAPTFDILRLRVNKIYSEDVPHAMGAAYFADARDLTKHIPQKWHGSVKLVFTSPPYLDVISYGKYNWLRLWFLGYDDYRPIEKATRGGSSLAGYLNFICDFGQNLRPLLKKNAYVVLVIGDVFSTRKNERLELGELVTALWTHKLGYRHVRTFLDEIRQEDKVSRLWGKDKTGKATKVDRIIVFKA